MPLIKIPRTVSLYFLKPYPICIDIRSCINYSNKIIYQLFLETKLQIGLNDLVNGHQNLLILAVGIMILHHKYKNIININLHLLYQFHLKTHVLNNTILLTRTRFVLFMKVMVYTRLILQINRRNNLIPFKLIKSRENITQMENVPENNITKHYLHLYCTNIVASSLANLFRSSLSCSSVSSFNTFTLS